MRLYRIGRFERGVFAEIGADRRATWQGLGIVGMLAVATPVIIYAAFFVYYAVSID